MTRHYQSGTREYQAYRSTWRRCYDPENQSYHVYGGRGIEMADEWRDDPAQFYKDMGECPAGYRLDRRDTEANFTPGNCHWVPRNEHSYVGGSTGELIEHEGVSLTAAAWSRRIGISRAAMHKRLKRGLRPPELFIPSTRHSCPTCGRQMKG